MREGAPATALHRETPDPPKGMRRRIWFGILAAPVAWTVHELVGVIVVGRRCMHEGSLGSAQWATVIGISVLAAVVAAAGAWVAFRVFRQRTPERITRAEGWERVEFMAIAGVIISLSLLANIIMMGVMPMIVVPCMVAT